MTGGIVLQSLATIHCGKPAASNDLTALELTGTDRVGLLSEVFAVLAELECDVVEAKVWTHNGRIASLIYVKDCNSGSPIKDSQKIDTIVGRLRNVLKGQDDILYAKTSVSMTVTHTERRLHQMMFADRDYERKPVLQHSDDSPVVTVQNWVERGYSVVNVQCKDRMKLLFDVVCTLTDMDYVVFHGTITTAKDRAYLVNVFPTRWVRILSCDGSIVLLLTASVLHFHQELYIRHTDGTPISSEAERQRVIQCLQASVERRTSQVHDIFKRVINQMPRCIIQFLQTLTV